MKIDNVEALFEGIPRKKLIFLPTPFHKLERLSKKYGVEIYIKRDDLTGPSPYGGNKTRYLEFILGSGLKKGVEYFITTGRYQTNSGMEVAECCRKCGLKPILYLGDSLREGIPPKEYRSNLMLDKILGCEIHLVDFPIGEAKRVMERRCLELCEKRKEELEREGHKAMVLPEGACAPEAFVSYVLGFKEIIDQSTQRGVALDYLFHAIGTGGTLPGLLAGKLLLKSDIKIVSVSIGHPRGGEDAEHRVQYRAEEEGLLCDRTEGIFHQLGVDPPSREEILSEINIDWNLNLIDGNYSGPSKAGTEAIQEMAREEGLFLDPIYTGKGFAGLLSYIREGKVSKESKIAFLHTGGTGALFATEATTGNLLA